MSTVHIIGAGPAGLTAARELALNGIQPIVYEMDQFVGGISRTEAYKGFRFDIGGHRFYTKVSEIEELWHEVMPDNFVKRPRLSRIYYDGKFYHYPLELFNVLNNLGILESARSVLSVMQSRLFPTKPEITFEDWVTNRFGKRLFDRFFRVYTEKVWGIPVDQIRADWASQRIRDLSFWSAVQSAIFKSNGNIKTLITEFEYPTHGPGMMWEAFQDEIEKLGGKVVMNTKVVGLDTDNHSVTHLHLEGSNQETTVVETSNIISTTSLQKLIMFLQDHAPQAVIEAAKSLQYRDFLMVCIILDIEAVFPDNWIYIHSPDVQVGRIQNFKNWSMDMVPNPMQTSLGMEYFCNVGDDLWEMDSDTLIELASKEIEALGLAPQSAVIDGTVVRQRKAYPVYNIHYLDSVFIIRDYLAQFENLQTAGRNGLHRYNNQDHSMLTGLLAARNLLGETHDLWDVNTERSYYESIVVEKNS